MSIPYPYMPEGRSLKFVSLDHQWMQAARAECDTNGNCSWWPTGAVVVNDDKVVGRGANNGTFNPICPRVEKKCPSGTGYDLCSSVCNQGSHAEIAAVTDALKTTPNLSQADLYLFGHWWCCQPCWDVMLTHDIRDVYLLENAHEIFHKDARLAAHGEREAQIKNGQTLTSDQARWIIE